MLVVTECKRCPKCGETKAVEEFYLDRTRGRTSGRDGYATKCRACFRAYYAANRERRIAYQVTYNRRHHGGPLTVVERDRLVAAWQEAAAWVAGQLAIVRRLETGSGPGQRDKAIQRALDRPDPEDS